MFAFSINERSVEYVTIRIIKYFAKKRSFLKYNKYSSLLQSVKIEYFVQNVVRYCLQWIFVFLYWI